MLAIREPSFPPLGGNSLGDLTLKSDQGTYPAKEDLNTSAAHFRRFASTNVPRQSAARNGSGEEQDCVSDSSSESHFSDLFDQSIPSQESQTITCQPSQGSNKTFGRKARKIDMDGPLIPFFGDTKAFISYLDFAIRHAIGQSSQRSDHAFRMTEESFTTSLREICPAVFDPGYFEAMIIHANHIPVLASSVSSIINAAKHPSLLRVKSELAHQGQISNTNPDNRILVEMSEEESVYLAQSVNTWKLLQTNLRRPGPSRKLSRLTLVTGFSNTDFNIASIDSNRQVQRLFNTHDQNLESTFKLDGNDEWSFGEGALCEGDSDYFKPMLTRESSPLESPALSDTGKKQTKDSLITSLVSGSDENVDTYLPSRHSSQCGHSEFEDVGLLTGAEELSRTGIGFVGSHSQAQTHESAAHEENLFVNGAVLPAGEYDRTGFDLKHINNWRHLSQSCQFPPCSDDLMQGGIYNGDFATSGKAGMPNVRHVGIWEPQGWRTDSGDMDCQLVDVAIEESDFDMLL
ncbi:MAG: hypothetical protein Q9227_000853 [Pyrenula ochraceoflavens]